LERVPEAIGTGMTIGTVVGAGMTGATQIAEKVSPEKEKEMFDDLEIIEQEEQPLKEQETGEPASETYADLLDVIKNRYKEGGYSEKDIEALKEKFKKEIKDEVDRKEFVDEIENMLHPKPKQEVTPENQARMNAFDEVGKRTWEDDFVTGQMKIAPETKETKNIQKVADTTKMGKVVFYDAPGTQLDGVKGFYDPITKQIFVNKNIDDPLLVITWHESFHKLKDEAPDLYKRLILTLRGKAVGYQEYIAKINKDRKARGISDLTDKEALSEEFIADFAREAVATPEFWKKLHAANPNATRKLAEILIDLINQIRKTLGVKTKTYFKGIDAVGELAKTYAEFAKREGGAAPKAETTTSKVSDRRWIDTEHKGDEKRVEQRRVDEIGRKKIDEMTEEEKGIALKYHELTGLLSKRAYEESEKKSVQVSVDVDALKWVNDTFGHDEGGNELLKIVAKALSDTGIDAYHISGDEFYLQADSMVEAGQAVKQAVEYLENNPITLAYPDGTQTKYKAGFSYGAGKDADSKEALRQAERGLQKHKTERKLSKRGEKPTVGLEESTEGDKIKDREGDAGQKVIPPDNDQLIKVALDNDIKYTKRVKIGNRTATASRNAGDALSDVSEKRAIMKRILDCV